MTIYHWTPGEKTHRHGNIQIQIHTFFNFSQTDRGKEDVTKQKFNKLVDNFNFYVQERMINCTFCLRNCGENVLLSSFKGILV